MEYCPEGPLVDYLNSRLANRPSENEILTIFSQICLGVAHMHSSHPPIAHRDLKMYICRLIFSENVLLNQGRFQLCDFGSCTSVATPCDVYLSIQEIRKLEEDIGKYTTMQYRAPEMCDLYTKKGLNEKVDIWVKFETILIMRH
jgi:serine/threonine protein kinase